MFALVMLCTTRGRGRRIILLQSLIVSLHRSAPVALIPIPCLNSSAVFCLPLHWRSLAAAHRHIHLPLKESEKGPRKTLENSETSSAMNAGSSVVVFVGPKQRRRRREVSSTSSQCLRGAFLLAKFARPFRPRRQRAARAPTACDSEIRRAGAAGEWMAQE